MSQGLQSWILSAVSSITQLIRESPHRTCYRYNPCKPVLTFWLTEGGQRPAQEREAAHWGAEGGAQEEERGQEGQGTGEAQAEQTQEGAGEGKHQRDWKVSIESLINGLIYLSSSGLATVRRRPRRSGWRLMTRSLRRKLRLPPLRWLQRKSLPNF